jgi:hypothetical protein
MVFGFETFCKEYFQLLPGLPQVHQAFLNGLAASIIVFLFGLDKIRAAATLRRVIR